MKCYLCSPPACLLHSSPGQWSAIMHEHHVKEFHLGPYKPFKCTVPKCNQSVTVAPVIASHAQAKHNGAMIQPVKRGSDYLDALSNVMMQCNLYASANSPHLSCKMIQTIRNHCQRNDTAICEPAEVEQPFRIASEEFIETNDTPADCLPISSSTDSGCKKKGIACSFCPKTLPNRATLKLHEDRNHNLVSNGKHKCGKCTRRYHYYSSYRIHFKLIKGCDSENESQPMPPKKMNKKSKRLMKSSKKNENSQVRGKGVHYCSGCKERIDGRFIVRHIATVHVKQPFAKCNACGHTSCNWNMGNMRMHIERMHNGKATITDLRANFTEEVRELRCKLIKRTDGVDVTPYRPRVKLSHDTIGFKRIHNNTFQRKRNDMRTGGRKTVAHSAMRGKGLHYCSECNENIGTQLIVPHIANVHIKKAFSKCSACDHAIYRWKLGNMRMHIRRKHNGMATITDLRANFTEEVRELRGKLIKRVDGGDVTPYRTRVKLSHNTTGVKMTRDTVQTKSNHKKGGRKKVVSGSRRYCKKCNVWVSTKDLTTHLANQSHVGKHCLHCNGCQYKCFWGTGKMHVHLREKHSGSHVGFTDKRNEIREEIENERKLYIE